MLEDLASGECRRVSADRPDLHVYCHNPMRPFLRPDGKQAWRRDEATARYCIVCPDEGLDYLPYDEWMPLDDAERLVARVLYGDPRPTKRGARC